MGKLLAGMLLLAGGTLVILRELATLSTLPEDIVQLVNSSTVTWVGLAAVTIGGGVLVAPVIQRRLPRVLDSWPWILGVRVRHWREHDSTVIARKTAWMRLGKQTQVTAYDLQPARRHIQRAGREPSGMMAVFEVGEGYALAFTDLLGKPIPPNRVWMGPGEPAKYEFDVLANGPWMFRVTVEPRA